MDLLFLNVSGSSTSSIYRFKFPGFLMLVCSWFNFIQELFNWCFCSEAYLHLPTDHCSCMILCPVKIHKYSPTIYLLFMHFFSPLHVAPGMLMCRRGLYMKHFNALSVPGYILLDEVFGSSDFIFDKICNVPIF